MRNVPLSPLSVARSFILIAGLAGFALGASAQIVEYDFTGTTTAAYGGVTNGQSFAATLVVDYSKLTIHDTNDSTYDDKYVQISDPAAVTGVIALSGGAVVAVGQGAGGSYGESYLKRNLFGGSDGHNEFSVVGVQYNTPFGSDPASFSVIYLDAVDNLGTASKLFTTAAGDVSNPQAINWLAGSSGSLLFGLFEYKDSFSDYGANLTIASVTESDITTAVPEPETYALMLAGLGSLGVAARRRRRRGGADEAPLPRKSRHSRSFMTRVLALLSTCLIPAALLPSIAHADPLPLGFFVWDVTDPGVSGQFDIVNQTGPNASGDATWPVDTAVSFANLALTVHYTDGSSSVFGSSYFALGADGLSFDGTPIAVGGASVLPTDATLTGLFGVADVMLFDGRAVSLMPSFAAAIAFNAAGLADGDLQLIEATPVVAAVPEPATTALMLVGLAALALACRTRRRTGGRRALGVATAACLMASAPAWATVKLNAWVAPSGGVAGTTLVNITATGAPLAPSQPLQAASVALAESCGGPAISTVNASSSKWITGNSYRIQFALPAMLLARTYAASVSGTTANGTAFASSNCSLVNVSAPADGWKMLIGRSWTLPAATEAYKCTALQVTQDMYISALRPVSPQGDFWKVLTVRDVLPPAQTGDFDCTLSDSARDKGVHMAGPGTGDFVLPAGTAVHVKPGQFLLLNVHVVNGGTGTASGTSAFQVQTVDAARVTDEAEMILLGTVKFLLPSSSTPQDANVGCPYLHPTSYRVFAVQPHMHARGIHSRFSVFSANNIVTPVDAPYSVDAQVVYPVAPPVEVDPEDLVGATCTYLNNTGTTIDFGDSAASEQCFVGLYRTPVTPLTSGDPRGTVLECVNLQ